MKRRLLFAFTVVLTAATALMCASDPSATTSESPTSEGAVELAAQGSGGSPESDDQKTLYALGAIVAQRSGVAGMGLSDAELAMVAAGVTDALAGREPQVPLQEWGPKVNTFIQAKKSVLAQTEKVAGQEFCDKAAAEPGAIRTASGAVYREIEAGDGPQPAATDTIKLHYHGTLRDGSVFDSSVQRGTPAQFQVNGVIPCFGEGLQQMKVGGKGKMTCPSDTAYGDQGRPGIPPGATLVFEVELLEIVTAGG